MRGPIKKEGAITSREGKKSLLPRIVVMAAGVCAVAFGMYLALDRTGPPDVVVVEETVTEETAVQPQPESNGDEQATRTTAAAQDPGFPHEDLSAFVAENGLEGQFWMLIDKSDFTLSAYMGAEPLSVYEVAIGSNGGDKQKVGDRRTPEGVFTVERIHDSRSWVHDFGDGKGPVEGAYGPWFIRLKTGWKGIGIHGTHDPSSIGRMVTEGCIRLTNDNLGAIIGRVKPGVVVLIRE
ncbi:MAG: L,D-transpeptidase [Synergistota bacterium]|nr:L,D-transpeptidase [Synergistota bacterium]